ncbi:SIR2 family protein [Clostridium beijerinckii]|jgi:hypothetical protein|uniref:NAD(+) hydrolase ThsA n=2 Tax=Clostridium beijerinckii TaxID=1520 RepID=A0AAE2RTZ2_CLOBE|nr:SIR2 family protein [Clostridium beijerinckii]ABR34958.1 conserved hypothetical protein [Clostridium beijerinckii NCIMB 8052]AIU01497.1 hypothetical protein Cbs_2808 [Clostridium beijerinckii ATCC 35702]MBF7810406.1 SIR2 family protein [Clostridium beijerinckii]NRT23672.1 hypothetical protein [Clostridium beijerinckii]NRT68748.1 hypothetical protein [Clostridium beijerinckii]
MKKELIHFADRYLKDIKDENAAIFAGAGLSVGTGLVNWKGLLKDTADELGLNVDKEYDLIALAQYYENEKGGRGSINEQLISEFTKDVEISENHKILASLPIKTYWTTNYDKLIEKTLEYYGKTVDTKICSANLAVNIPRRDAVVYKMHGDISLPHDAVITKDDYENYNEKRQVFTTALQGDLITKTFLFIGFSFDDPNLEYILSRIRILLGNNTRDHYCFLKRVDKEEFVDEKDYVYEKTKQDLKVKDLKRYRIQALLIDDFSEITDVLLLIKSKLKRSNIFISGAAHEYGKWSKDRAENIVYNLSKRLSEEKFKIISGFGLGIGSSVINGVLSHVYSNIKKHTDDFLILRPFPQNIKDENERVALWNKYREEMISDAGIAVFFFGNKIKDGNIIDSDGVFKEFEIAIRKGLKVIPVGCTGYVSNKLWNRVIDAMDDYYPQDEELYAAIKSLGKDTEDDSFIINNIIKSINILQGKN